MLCFFCHKDIGIEGKVGRGETCPYCNSDLKVCKNCGFYSERVYNECAEHQAERVVEKTKANYCEFFTPVGKKAGAGLSEKEKSDAIKKAAESLFKK